MHDYPISLPQGTEKNDLWSQVGPAVGPAGSEGFKAPNSIEAFFQTWTRVMWMLV